ncbi:hypothetical protein [Anabaena sp. AL09]|jgi:hypothetical protein|uniref:hypothetical protein n=1 Tax=Anabaena sp. AL09 TaxID=1710891 RepID=UPI0007FF81FC|nr:hypothetical protein [Anabaena sp. AL09]OBQ13215.1 MAG: hypothetical protein AN490_03185 [Anabaena sp. AL09]
MTVISTFELLVKPQLPKKTISNIPSDIAEQLAPLTRTIVQGYFLTIANLESTIIQVSLVFTVKTPKIDPDDNQIITLLDTSGQNIIGRVFQEKKDDASKTRFTIPIAGNDTVLFILQPNVTDLELLQAANFEVRGYAEIFLSSVSTPKTAKILVTPEHRGTFFGSLNPADKDDSSSKLGEVAYGLPIAGGNSLLELIREG